MEIRLALALMYKPPNRKPIMLGMCCDPLVVEQAARAALAELDEMAAPRADDDPVLDLQRQLEAEKVRQILYAVLPVLKPKAVASASPV